ncbi:MAG: hypothetical protein J6T55_00395, partial [Alphaproteobacteria bacterium]|nr:hypothetical protein [Alphaproteobacteria bacterium]
EDIDCKTECATCQIPEGDFKGICAGECDALCQEGDTCGDNECVVCDPETKTCQNRCIEVEYLESTGTQYIDTGINTTSNIGFDVAFKWDTFNTVNSRFLGVIKQVGSTYLRHHSTDSGTSFSYHASDTITLIQGPATTGFHSFSYNSITKKFNFDGTEITAQAPTTFDIGLDFWFFGRNSNTESLKNYASVKIYYCKIYDGNTLVRDFIPVIAPFKPKGKQNCMFDRVTKKLFCNKGSGADFKIPGDITIPWARDNEEGSCKYDIDCASEDECTICDPSTKTCQNGCTEVEYLESTGTQYIDLGITSKSSMRAKSKFNLANVSAQAVFGSATVSATGVGVFFGTAATGAVYCNKTDTPISPSLTLVANTNYEFDMSLTTVSINGVNYTASTTSDNNYNMLLFARILAGNVDRRISGKIYYFKLYDNGVLVRDFIPVLAPDGEACMYDKVTKKLFCNAGTGTFKTNKDS